MANEIRADLNVRGEQVAAQKLKKFGDAADKAGDQLEGMGDQATGAGKAADKAGDEFRDTAGDADYLATRIAAATATVKALAAQLNKTGDESLLKDITKGNRDISRLTRISKILAPDEDGGNAGRSWIKGFAEAWTTGAAAVKGAAVPVVAGVAIAAAPLIGATIGAAVLGGVGAGGIIGGISLAASDPRVAEAGTQLGATLLGEFGSRGASEPFVAPLLDSMEILKGAAKDTAGDTRAAFATIAPVLRPLTVGLVGFVNETLPGFTRGLESSKPVLRALAELLPQIGRDVGKFIATVGDGSDGAVLGLKGIVDITGDALEGFGNIIWGLSQIYEGAVRAGAAVTGVLEDLYAWVPLLGDFFAGTNDDIESQIGLLERSKSASGDYAGAVQTIGESAEETASKIKTLADAIDEVFGRTMSLDQATLSFKNGLVDLQAELTDGKRSLDDNTQAGRDNIAAILEQIQRTEDLRKANADSAMGIDAANRLYETHIEQLRRTLTNLGYNKAQVNELIDRYKQIPKSVETTIGIILKTQGSESAWAALRKAEREDEAGGSTLHAGGRASGGPVSRGKTYWVGEAGPELVTFGDDGYVHNAADSQAMVSGASGGSARSGGGAVVTVRFVVDGTDEDMKRMIRKMVKVDGGGSVQVAFGEN